MELINVYNTSIERKEYLDYFNDFLNEANIKPKSAETYKKAIKQFSIYLKYKGISSIPTKADFMDYQRWLNKHYELNDDGTLKYFDEEGNETNSINGQPHEREYKPTTARIYFISVKAFFKWLEEEYNVKNNIKNLKPARVDNYYFKKDYLTETQIIKLLESIDRSTITGKRDYAMISLMLCTGRRTIEIERANIEDIRPRNNSIYFYYMGKGKDGKYASNELPQQVYEAIQEYLNCRKVKPEEPLFVSHSNNDNGGRLTTRSISRIVKNHLINAGYNIPTLTAHSLRHTTATQMRINNVPLEQVQQVLGHSNISTTMIYNHNIERDKNHAEIQFANAFFK